MKGTLTVINSNHTAFNKGRVLWASEFGKDWTITVKDFKRLVKVENTGGVIIWAKHDRNGIKT